MIHVQHVCVCRWASVRRATGFVGQRLERSAADLDRAAPDKRVIIGVITGVVRGDDIGQLLLRDGLLLAGVSLLDFIHHGDHAVETLGHAGPHPVLKE